MIVIVRKNHTQSLEHVTSLTRSNAPFCSEPIRLGVINLAIRLRNWQGPKTKKGFPAQASGCVRTAPTVYPPGRAISALLEVEIRLRLRGVQPGPAHLTSLDGLGVAVLALEISQSPPQKKALAIREQLCSDSF